MGCDDAEEPLERLDRCVAGDLLVQARLDRRKVGPVQAVRDPGGGITPGCIQPAGELVVDIGEWSAVRHEIG